jgi:hypothetical protein
MTWHVQFRQDGTDPIVRLPSPDQAIEVAYRLLDDGWDAYCVGTGPVTDSITKEQIARIYDQW